MKKEIEKQIGGDHYASEYQCVEFCKNHNFNPDQFNILKYVLRFPKKAGLVDLNKSLWYDNDAIRQPYPNTATWDYQDTIYFLKVNNVEAFDWHFIYELTSGDYSSVRTQIMRIIEREYPEQPK